MDKPTFESLGIMGTALAGILASWKAWSSRKLDHDEKNKELNLKEEAREDDLMASHIEQLQKLWHHSLKRVEVLSDQIAYMSEQLAETREELGRARVENEHLRLEVHKLTDRLKEMEHKNEAS